MRYAVTYFYLAVILMFKHKRESHQEKPISWYSSVAFVVIILSIVSNIQISNVAYVKKDLERQATFSTMTRVLSRLEEYENYDYKESSVAIVGSVNKDQVGVNSGFVDRLIGISQESQITYRDSMARYFDIVLQYPIDLCSEEEMDDICKTEKFQKMGVFPQKDSIDMVGDIIVVKMSE